MNNNRLIVLLGPTAVGKTKLSINIAKHTSSNIISADSRQIFREIPIGTAAPLETELKEVRHHFIGTHSITDRYGAKQFEIDVINLLPKLFEKNRTQLMSGGSMMYIDAVCKGIDDIPDVNPIIRQNIYQQFEQEGLTNILEDLKRIDPVYYSKVDKNNYKRVLHGYEVYLSTGKPYSSFLTGEERKRDFEIIKIGINREREDLYNRINQRVDKMIEDNLEEECREVYKLKSLNLNALNTVGYKEFFLFFDGIISKNKAIEKIKKNSRNYARKQITWWKKDKSIRWFHPDDISSIYKCID